ncbi:membrane dipeptidase [Sinorhizobium meliloti]|uniref:membrane dipeptidase n=1 Tax=Rhizobium meliloti TaxID=382 RepID=UPI000FD7D8EA|nr:dipeptidase [Sinorhizobium meliloti]RVH37105.1 peptidase M19 [Sinorhizobium meliloti]
MIIDALQCGHFNRESFEALRRGGYSAVTPTLGFWEGTMESLDSLARWRDMERDNADLILIARTAADIERAEREGKLAVVLGYQNSNLFEDRIAFVEFFAELGVRVVQLTYNNQNELGGSCYEENDSGLARFGRDVVREMNRVGMLVDLSHVGDRTTLDAIEWSEKPVAITHANAASLFAHKRNKSDKVIKALSERGGVIGCVAYRNITPDAACATVDGWCEMVARTVDIAGIDHVGIGTDISHNHTPRDYDWMRKGRWTRSVQYGAGSPQRPGAVAKPEWLLKPENLQDVAPALLRVGFNQEEAKKILRGNWLRLYAEVFRPN